MKRTEPNYFPNLNGLARAKIVQFARNYMQNANLTSVKDFNIHRNKLSASLAKDESSRKLALAAIDTNGFIKSVLPKKNET